VTDQKRYGNGPLHLGMSDYQYPDLKDYLAAWKAASGFQKDGNNGNQVGGSWYPNTMNPFTGERSQAANSYYDPVSSRSNLNLMLQTTANELVLDGIKKLTARGVKITDEVTGKTSIVYAKKEVILAAGAVNTPKLLQLSGIGPKSVLDAAGIKVKLAHEGVGANFQDHPSTTVLSSVSNSTNPSLSDPTFNASAWAQYEKNKTGPYTQTWSNNLAMISLPELAPKTYKDLAKQIRDQKSDAFLPAIYKGSEKLIKGVAAQRKVLAKLFQDEDAALIEYPISSSGARVVVCLEKPLARGSITINPSNPQGPPKVFYNALSNPVDKSVLASGVRYVRTVFKRPEVKKFSITETSPGAQYTGDDEIINRQTELGSTSPTLAHPSGSCAMMPEKYGGCVSDKLEFYGVDKLSIVDASILPLVPTQHLQSTMYAVGEKAADLIKKRA